MNTCYCIIQSGPREGQRCGAIVRQGTRCGRHQEECVRIPKRKKTLRRKSKSASPKRRKSKSASPKRRKSKSASPKRRKSKSSGSKYSSNTSHQLKIAELYLKRIIYQKNLDKITLQRIKVLLVKKFGAVFFERHKYKLRAMVQKYVAAKMAVFTDDDCKRCFGNRAGDINLFMI